MRFDRVRSIVSDLLMCAGSIVYDLIACQAIASDQYSPRPDNFALSGDPNDKLLVCALNTPMTSHLII